MTEENKRGRVIPNPCKCGKGAPEIIKMYGHVWVECSIRGCGSCGDPYPLRHNKKAILSWNNANPIKEKP